MKVTLNIPDEIFWKIAAKAEQFDQRVDEYNLDLLVAAACAATVVESDPVFRMWRGGYTDKQIGAHLNLTNSAVQFRRRKYGLPANRRAVEETSEASRLAEQQRKAVARKEAA